MAKKKPREVTESDARAFLNRMAEVAKDPKVLKRGQEITRRMRAEAAKLMNKVFTI